MGLGQGDCSEIIYEGRSFTYINKYRNSLQRLDGTIMHIVHILHILHISPTHTHTNNKKIAKEGSGWIKLFLIVLQAPNFPFVLELQPPFQLQMILRP